MNRWTSVKWITIFFFFFQVTRQVAKCKCPKRFQVEQIGANKYRVSTLLPHTMLIVVLFPVNTMQIIQKIRQSLDFMWETLCKVGVSSDDDCKTAPSASRLTFCAFIVLYITSSTLETRYIWKFYSVYNLFCFVAYTKAFIILPRWLSS